MGISSCDAWSRIAVGFDQRFGAKVVPGQHLLIAVWWSWFFFLFGSYCLSPARVQEFDWCLECDDTGEFDWSAGRSRLQCRELIKMKNSRLRKQGLNRLNLLLFIVLCLFDEPCHDSGIKWLDPCYLLNWGAPDQWYHHAKKIYKDSPVLH